MPALAKNHWEKWTEYENNDEADSDAREAEQATLWSNVAECHLQLGDFGAARRAALNALDFNDTLVNLVVMETRRS